MPDRDPRIAQSARALLLAVFAVLGAGADPSSSGAQGRPGAGVGGFTLPIASVASPRTRGDRDNTRPEADQDDDEDDEDADDADADGDREPADRRSVRDQGGRSQA